MHQFVFMSNHYHLMVTDPAGRLGDFLHRFDRNLAKSLNAYRKRSGCFFDANEPARVQRLETEEAILDKLAYICTNPVSAALVSDYRHWPGMVSRPADMLSGAKVASRPPVYFQAKTSPSSVELKLTMPALFYGREQQIVAMLDVEIERRSRVVRAEVARRGRRFLGRQGVLATNWQEQPVSQEGPMARNPTFIAITRDAWREAVRRLREFRYAYRKALTEWRAGNHNIEFPPGTYWMVRFAGVRCASA